MTDKKDASSSDPARQLDAASSARPHATLDLKATEIKDKSAASAAEASSAAKASAASSSTGAKPSGASATGDAAKTPPKSIPPPARNSGIGSFLSHMVAGILGGALTLYGIQVLAPALGLSSGDEVAIERTTALESRIMALESRPTDAGTVGTDTEKVAQLDKRLADLDGLSQKLALLEETQAKVTADQQTVAARLEDDKDADSSLAERLNKLDERLGLIASTASNETGGGRVPQITALTGKITDLETALAAQVASLRNSLPQDIEQRVATIAATSEAAKAGATRTERELTDIRTEQARLTQRIEGLKADGDRVTQTLRVVQESTGLLTSSVEDLRGNVEQQLKSVARPAQVSAAVSPVAAKLDELKQSVAAVVQSEDERRRNAERIVLALELGNLKRAIDRGQPYDSELVAVKKASGDRIDLTALSGFRDTGVPTLAELQREFGPLVNAALDADTDLGDGSVVDRLLAGAKSVVRVRKVGYAADDTSTQAVLARMETALNAGDVGVVVSESKKLPERARLPLNDWLAKVAARQAADAAIAAVETDLKASFTGSTAPAAGQTDTKQEPK